MLPGVCDGLPGIVDADHLGCRKHAGQIGSDISNAAPEIEDPPRLELNRQDSRQVSNAPCQKRTSILSGEPYPLTRHPFVTQDNNLPLDPQYLRRSSTRSKM